MPIFSTEKELNGMLDRIKHEAEESRGDLDKRFDENLQLIRGKQWKGDRPPYFLYNVIESAVEDKSGKLGETKPKINIMPMRDGLDGAAEVLHRCISGIWDRRNIEYETERIAYYGAAAGVAFVATPYNRRMYGGIGDADFVLKDPRTCGMDPSVVSAKDGDSGEYVFMEDFVPLDYVRREYPGRGALVKSSEKISGYEKSTVSRGPAQLLKGTFNRLFHGANGETKSAIPRTVIEEFFIKDRRENIEEDGPIPITKTTTSWCTEPGSEPFPGGRRIIRAGQEILEDTWNPYWDGAPPLDALSWKIDLESMFGPDEVQGVKRMQEAVNRLGDAYVKNAIINSVVRVILDHGALSPEERNKLSNTAAEIIEKAPGRSFEYQVPPTLPVDVINFAERLMDYIRQKIGSVIPPTQKDVPSIVTGPAIEGLQVMVQTPLRTAARRVEELYTRIGQKLISRVIQYYTSDRIIQYIGADARWMQFEFKRRELIKKADGTARTQSDLRKYFHDFMFAIDPGSSLAATKIQRAMMAFNLVQLGTLHPREVLIELGYQNPDEKIKKAKEAIAEGLIQQGKPGGQRSQSMGQSPLAA